jgi:hypothetical protein
MKAQRITQAQAMALFLRQDSELIESQLALLDTWQDMFGPHVDYKRLSQRLEAKLATCRAELKTYEHAT